MSIVFYNICPYDYMAIPTMEFCEDNLCSFIKAPANTLSNLTYIFIGIYLIAISRKEKNLFLKLMGGFAILCGFTSGIYHATFSRFWQIFNNGSIFIFVLFLLIFNLYRFKKKYFSFKNLFILYVFLNIVSLIIFLKQQVFFGINIGIPIIIFFIFTLLFTEFLLYKKANEKYKLKNIFFAILLLIIAWIFWCLDFFRIWCHADSSHIINGHSVWHLISSISFIFIYRFYKQFSNKL